MKNTLFTTVLVANRGEIAVRIIRTLRAMGIKSVAVYSDADAGARHVREADQAIRIGSAAAPDSYLNITNVLEACRQSGARAVHPGYGFLSENIAFARALKDAGITFIGPNIDALLLMGDKIRSKNHVAAHDVPVTPGIAEPELSDEELIDAAESIGFPVLIKPSAGGGGKGMVAVDSPEKLPAALLSARRTALSSFGDDTLFLERLVRSPRHIEVQILADTHGNTVHLGERECSLQRRHQKVIEEAPAPLLENLKDGSSIRAQLGAAAVAAAESVNYVGAGTVEFLVSDEAPGEFFFMEMNTRLQVEHPVTEEVVRVAGERLDLVAAQVRIAAGEPLGFTQDQVSLHGHAIEARVYAEDPAHDFMPSTGRLLRVLEPGGEHVRVDSSLVEGLEISPHYDPMLAKLIAWGDDRDSALARLDRALASTEILGVLSNIEYLRLLLIDPEVRAGNLDTTLIERKMPDMIFRSITHTELVLAAAMFIARSPGSGGTWRSRDSWRLGARTAMTTTLEVEGRLWTLTSVPTAGGRRFTLEGQDFEVTQLPGGNFAINGVQEQQITAFGDDSTLWIGRDGWAGAVRSLDQRELLHRELANRTLIPGEAPPEVRSPMPGTVIAVGVSDGQLVRAGEILVTIEAMKMEHPMFSPGAGTVSIGRLRVGDLVKANQVVATLDYTAEAEAS
ncbi:acetyl/propionyl/methylcrotonyl-CoA carboxylase subunit alpha [Paeniglutamicibacter terrestris]|uniref:biotin carboxylase n=1 Tax=Paeniglutamicibacter terrestris TaxID=2723403 RepID=A0ABX1G1Z8_9MICC|nr:biotin carboxylase N-terminal domain-containing protein [Paeniglutamicibacter terrestris]ASN37836.1 acetyl/propionyl-CoA carboxylase subunit alpha [Arthrobacter sp. 7749]NKG19974.1 ATP-grasp domain-containing protein [Paeniglutamicibacter terrestris]